MQALLQILELQLVLRTLIKHDLSAGSAIESI